MGWLKRIFGKEKKSSPAKTKSQSSASFSAPASSSKSSSSIPPEKVGLDGEFDESGLAKRVALAFDEDAQLDDVETLWVAQLGSQVVLKGTAPSQDILDKMVSVAKKVDGADSVSTEQVTVS
ncbi:MAG: phospholipid-binding protein [Spirulinaceae cyanobacterium]